MINYYLKNKNAVNQTLIFMTVFYDNIRVKLSTGCSVDPKLWLEKKQRVKVTIENQDANIINDKLDQYEVVMDSLMKKYRDEDFYPSPEVIKADLMKLNKVPTKSKKAKTFWDHFEDFIAEKRKINPDVRHYHNGLRKHLRKTEEIIGRPLTFALINAQSSRFNEEWTNYLSFIAINSQGDSGLMPNSIGKENKNIKAFFNWCFDKNITSRFSLKGYPTIMEDVDNIYLTDADLEAIENKVIEDPKYAVVRDLFLVGCETGLRYSDYVRIQPHDFMREELHIVPKKTKKQGVKKVIIPLSERFKRILEKYDGVLPNLDKNHITNFNKMIREICESLNMKDEIKFYREIAGKTIKVTKYKFEEVSSHTCRRTFCTLKFLKGMPAQAIMKFTGHTSERNFLKYLKLDAELTAQKYKNFF
jgi:integrase